MLNSKYNFGDCGRIYFGGDVYVNISFPNVGTYRYKAFSAGDAYYYNNDLPRTNAANDKNVYGIDLFKYFLDKSIATQAYSANVLNRFQDLIDLYYSAPSGSDVVKYVEADKDGNITKDAMRKIDNENGVGVGKDKFIDLVPPDPTDASTMMWYVD